jgi:hypothetical protein
LQFEDSSLLKERAQLKERMEDSEHQAGRWLELSERAFNFACYASYWFENEGLEDKNTILRTIGSNFILKDRKLSIELKNPWLMIRKNMEETQEQNKRLELSEKLVFPSSQPCQPSLSIAWLPGLDDVDNKPE